ncbi:MAG: hypothetical protein KY393_03865, partial [Actinobacteria bacterium]|nr:hypothetical protein [Actinomycetota bacterium]
MLRREKLQIAGRVFQSRLIFGTGGFTSLQTMGEALAASGAEMVTVAMRRVDSGAQGSILEVIEQAGCDVLYVPGGRAEQEAAYRAVVTAIRKGEVDVKRLRGSLKRIGALRRRPVEGKPSGAGRV